MRAAIHHYLLNHGAAGATAQALLEMVFTRPGRDAALGAHFIHTLLRDDPRFHFRDTDQRWIASGHDALSLPLAETEFAVVDLETTGGSPLYGDSIIEIGAVRLDRGRRVEQFSRLVYPGRPLPPFITSLTGITDAMLAGQPTIDAVLPEFLEFVGARPLVAHNARFDLGFLNAAAEIHRGHPLAQPHLCTLRLARRLLPELRRFGLDAVAAHFAIPLVDRHRALGDARVTAEVFTHLLELLPPRGVDRLDEALALQASARDGRAFSCPLPPAVVAQLPDCAGVYRFLDAQDHVLYVGKAKHLRRRVAQYLSNSRGHRNKTLDLIRRVHAVRVEQTESELEASLREAEIIRAEKPPYNQLRKHLPRIAFLKLSRHRHFPRLFVTSRGCARDGHLFGPFRSRESAQRVLELVTRVFRLRTCVGQLAPDPAYIPCVQGQIGACSAPCAAAVSPQSYADQVTAFRSLMAADPMAIEAARTELSRLRTAYIDAHRFEDATRTDRDVEQVDRLVRRQRAFEWIVARQHYVILQPSREPQQTLAYLVLGGRLIHRQAVRQRDDLRKMVERFTDPADRGLGADDVEGTTILAAWLRDRGEQDGFVFELKDISAVALLTQADEWAAALAMILSNPRADPARHQRERPARTQP